MTTGWTTSSLADLLTERDVRAGAVAEDYEVLSLTKRMGLIPQRDRFTKRVATEDISEYKVVEPGWIAYNPFVLWEGAIHALRRLTPGVVSPAYAVWERNEDDGGYLDHVLRSPALIARYESLAAGAVNRRRTVKKQDFLEISLLCPPLDEQLRIATVLNSLQRAVALQEAVLQSATELKQALLTSLFTVGARSEALRDTELGLRPDSWKVQPLAAIAKLASGGTPSRSKPEYWEGGSIPWVKTGEVNNDVIAETSECITQAGLDNSSAKKFPPGTLLMAMYGQGITRGRVALLGLEAATNQACVAIFPSEVLLSEFLFYLFQARYEEFRSRGHGANQPNLSAEILKSVLIAYPADTDEQQDIVRTLASVDERIRAAALERDLLNELYSGVLDAAVAGDVRVSTEAVEALTRVTGTGK